MPRRVLVLGGTAYFGKHLIDLLLKNGDVVFIATRGINSIPKGCTFIEFDRNANKKLNINLDWDVVYDQSCYIASTLKNMRNIMSRCGVYILTSSQAVYYSGLNICESQVNYSKLVSYKEKINSYGWEKLQAEAYARQFSNKAIFPRFPVVIGENDPLKRIQTLSQKVESRAIFLPASNPAFQVIDEYEAGRLLFLLSFLSVDGPVNLASKCIFTAEKLIHILSGLKNTQVNVEWIDDYQSNMFDLIKKENKTMCLIKQQSLGYKINDPILVLEKICKTTE